MIKIIIPILLSLSSFAQIEKHTISVGSRIVNLTTNKNSTKINLSPSAGIFVAKNTEVGINLNIEAFHSLYNAERSYLTGDLSSYIIYYIGNNKVQPYLLGQVYLDNKYLRFGGGLQYLIIPSIGIFIGTSFTTSSTPEFNISSGFSLYIPRRKKSIITN